MIPRNKTSLYPAWDQSICLHDYTTKQTISHPISSAPPAPIIRSRQYWVWSQPEASKNFTIVKLILQGRDSGNNFQVPEIGSDNNCFLFILFSYPHVVPSRFFKRPSFLGTDFCFWCWLGLTRNENVKSCKKSHFYFAFVPIISQVPTS